MGGRAPSTTSAGEHLCGSSTHWASLAISLACLSRSSRARVRWVMPAEPVATAGSLALSSDSIPAPSCETGSPRSWNGCSTRTGAGGVRWRRRHGAMTGSGFILLVRRWWWLIGLSALVGALAAWLIVSHAGTSYQADTSLLVGPVSGDFSTLHASGELGKTYAELAASRPVVQAAARSARVNLKPSELQTAVTAS